MSGGVPEVLGGVRMPARVREITSEQIQPEDMENIPHKKHS